MIAPIADAPDASPCPAWTGRLLRQELGVATGCTEPAAIALAACTAARALGGTVRAVAVAADVGTYKNALAVGLPGSDRVGPGVAAALGACVARLAPSMDLLGLASQADWARAHALLDGNRATAVAVPERQLHISATVRSTRGQATAVIGLRHDRVVALEVNGKALAQPASTDTALIDDVEISRRLFDAEAIVRAADALVQADLLFIEAALDRNRALVLDAGAMAPDALVAMAVRQRMAGRSVAVGTSGGSGNSGLTVSLGIWAAAQALDLPRETRLRGLAVGHFTNLAIKARIGRTGPMCGGVIASSTAVGAGLAYLRGGGAEAVDQVLREMVDTLAGTLCGGANQTCALKIAVGLRTAVSAAQSATEQPARAGTGGLAGPNAAVTLTRLAALADATGPALDLALVALLDPQTTP